MSAKHLAFLALALLMLSAPAAADDRLVDGVPLPSDAHLATASPVTALQRQWSGVWVGAWGGVLKHILLVESVAEDGAARVVYAVGERRGSARGRSGCGLRGSRRSGRSRCRARAFPQPMN